MITRRWLVYLRGSVLERLHLKPPSAAQSPHPGHLQNTRQFTFTSRKPSAIGSGKAPNGSSSSSRASPSPSSATSSTSSSPSSSSTAGAKPASQRMARLIARLPSRLQPYARRLQGAPVSHTVAFLILHELTAVVPLVGLAGLFHYADAAAVPFGWMTEHYGAYFEEGTRRFERYFRRKGWFGFGEGADGDEGVVMQGGQELALESGKEAKGGRSAQDVLRRWGSGDAKYKIVAEVALSYAIVKVLLPVRVVLSLWATPWFAGNLSRIGRFGGRKAP